MTSETISDADLTASEKFKALFGHIEPHTIWSFHFLGIDWNITNHLLTMWGAAAFVLALFAIGYGKKFAAGDAPRGPLANFLESLVLFVRDQMVFDTMGKENGRRFAPLFLTQFFFIWTMNLVGLLPIPHAGTATAKVAVTAGLATTTLVFMLALGMKGSGVIKFWTGLVPHGVPGFMWPLMFVVEVIGFFVKPFALTIRLFANMTGGHLVILSLYGMIYMASSMALRAGSLVAAFPMLIFVGVLELLVAFLQAFIFTFLSILFIQASLHPEH